MHTHLQHQVPESVRKKCLCMCKHAVTYFVPAISPGLFISLTMAVKVAWITLVSAIFFFPFTLFHLAYCSQKYFPKKQIESWPCLLKYFWFIVAWMFGSVWGFFGNLSSTLLSAVCLSLPCEGHVPATLNNCPRSQTLVRAALLPSLVFTSFTHYVFIEWHSS